MNSTRSSTIVAAAERVVRNGEIDLAVFEYGDPSAETVVLVHGWPDTHHLWEEVVPLLSDRFHVVSYDQIVANTRFSGVSPEAEAEKQERFDRLYARRNYGPEKVAGQIVKAVLRNKAVLPVTPESYQGYYASRLAPGLVRRFAKLDML